MVGLQTRQTGRLPAVVEILLIALIFSTIGTLVQGYSFGQENHLALLPAVFRGLDPNFAADDYFVNLNSTFSPRLYYSRLLIAAADLLGIPAAFFLLTILAHSFVVLVTFFVAGKMFPGSRLTILLAGALVVSIEGAKIGGAGDLINGELRPQNLIMGLALLSVWYGIRMRPVFAALLAGLAALVQPLVGLECGAVALATAATCAAVLPGDSPDRRRQRRATLLRTVFGAGILGSIIYVFWFVLTENPDLSHEMLLFLTRFRLPHHYYPSAFPPADIFYFACLVAAVALLWRRWDAEVHDDRFLSKRVLLTLGIVLCALAGGVVFVEIIPIDAWIKAQAFRLVFLVKWFALLLLARAVTRLLGPGKDRPIGLPVAYLIGFGPAQPAMMLHATIQEGIYNRFKPWLAGRRRGLVSLAVVAIHLGVVFYVASLHAPRLRNLTTLVLCGIVIAIISRTRRWKRLALLALFLGVAVGPLFVPADPDSSGPSRLRSILAPAPVYSLSHGTRGELQISAIAELARENTPVDATFVTPPYFGRFRLAARRALVVDFKLIGYSDLALHHWQQRLAHCYGAPHFVGWSALAEMAAAYRNISSQRLLHCAGKFGATYAVVEIDTPIAFPEIAKTERFRLVKIPEHSDLIR